MIRAASGDPATPADLASWIERESCRHLAACESRSLDRLGWASAEDACLFGGGVAMRSLDAPYATHWQPVKIPAGDWDGWGYLVRWANGDVRLYMPRQCLEGWVAVTHVTGRMPGSFAG